MAEIFVPIDLLFESARGFDKARRDVASTRLKLNRNMKKLEDTLKGVTIQELFHYYKELDQQMISCVEIMSLLAEQMQAIAERFAEVNK